MRLRAGARQRFKKKQRIVAFLRSSLKSGSIILSEAQASPPYSSRLSICFKLKEHCTVFTCASQRRPMTPPSPPSSVPSHRSANLQAPNVNA